MKKLISGLLLFYLVFWVVTGVYAAWRLNPFTGELDYYEATGAGGGAPTDADYLVGTANGSLSAEIVVGTSPGGELGGTWASPTIDDLFLKLGGDTTTGDYNFTAGNLTTTGIGTFNSVEIPTVFTAMTEPSGFVDRTATLSFVDATRVFTITGNHDIYINGVKTSKTTASITLDDATGMNWIYYNASGVLSQATSISSFALPFIATIYYNTVTDKGLFGEERHGIKMDGDTHHLMHNTVGVRYESGLAGTFADATFSVALGVINDEDLEHTITPAQTTCNVLYKDGAADFKWLAGQTKYYYEDGGSDLNYNNGNVLTALGANQYMAVWIFATNDTTTPIVSLIGQRTDANIADARTNNRYESLTLGTLPFQEMKLLYRVILRNDATPYEEAQDLRTISNLPAGTYVATDHGVLTGLADDDHTQYWVDSSVATRATNYATTGTLGAGQITATGLTVNNNDGVSGQTVLTVGDSDDLDDVKIYGDLVVTDISVITGGTLQLGANGTSGLLKLYSEQGATDYIASLYSNTAMTSAASFYLPADEPAATSIMTMTTGGVITNQSTSAGLYGALSDETGSASGSPLAVFNQAPTISSPVITNINPGGDFTLTNNSVAAFTSVNAGALVNTLYLKDGKVGIGTTAPGGKLEVASGNVFFGDTANTFSTQGLTINQAGNDDEILALKSSDISHSATSATEADTFFTLKKSHANLGGLRATSYYGNMSTGSHIINDIWIGQLTMTGANTGMVGTRFLEPDITAASALAVTTASTLYIRNAPTASGSASITNSYALWVDEGNVRFDGNVGIGTTGPTQALELGASKSMAFEGTTDDTVETIIGVIDPTTSDKTINFPNASGTVAVSATAPATLSALGDIGVNILGDLVCTSPVTGSANDIFPGANGTKATIALDFTAAWDFGGATSLEVPNDAAPVVDAIGEIALDTTDDQLVYFGASKRVLRYEEEKSCVIEDLAAADDNKSLGMFSEAVTITGIAVSYIGTGTTPATITLEDGSGNAMTITGGSPTAVAHGTNATFAAVTAGNTLVVGEILRFDVTNAVAPETDDYTIAIKYTVDAQ